jgi:hypothetical protein
MAKQHRNNNYAFTQASDCPITQVALYARVSTLNNQTYSGRGSEIG